MWTNVLVFVFKMVVMIGHKRLMESEKSATKEVVIKLFDIIGQSNANEVPKDAFDMIKKAL